MNDTIQHIIHNINNTKIIPCDFFLQIVFLSKSPLINAIISAIVTNIDINANIPNSPRLSCKRTEIAIKYT